MAEVPFPWGMVLDEAAREAARKVGREAPPLTVDQQRVVEALLAS